MNITPYLKDLENRIEPEVEEDLLDQWRRFSRGEQKEGVFAPARLREAAPPRIQWPDISINEALSSTELMVLHQFAGCSRQICSTEGRVLNVRSNYGVPILAVPFGCKLFMMSDQSNTLPNCHPIGPDEARAWIDRGVPDVEHPYLQQVYMAGDRFAEIAEHYPKIGKYVWIYHPDLQGPLDILELLWGSEIFLAFEDEPKVVHAMLQLITDFYLGVMGRWRQIVPVRDPELSAHWGLVQPGQVMIRLDSGMNLPPSYIDEFSHPYDQQLLQALGGGTIHACGRVDHWIGLLPQTKGAMAMNISQPELNDMEKVLRGTVDRGILLLDLRKDAVAALERAGRPLRGRVQVFK